MRQVVVAVDAETREGGEAIHVLGKGFQLVVVQAEATQTGAAPMSIASGGGGKAGGHNKTSKWGVGKVYIMREGGNDERASWGREGSSEGVSENNGACRCPFPKLAAVTFIRNVRQPRHTQLTTKQKQT